MIFCATLGLLPLKLKISSKKYFSSLNLIVYLKILALIAFYPSFWQRCAYEAQNGRKNLFALAQFFLFKKSTRDFDIHSDKPSSDFLTLYDHPFGKNKQINIHPRLFLKRKEVPNFYR
jgi:hypothetical protein